MREIAHYFGMNNYGLHMCFVFGFASQKFTAKKYQKIIEELEKYFPHPSLPAFALSNHDRSRKISILRGDENKFRLLVLMQFSLRGVPFIYYGEEIGMTNIESDINESIDKVGARFGWIPAFILKWLNVELTRDAFRSPMQWTDEEGAGFSGKSGVHPWLPIGKDYKIKNIKTQLKNKHSLYYYYRELIYFRKSTAALREGDTIVLNNTIHTSTEKNKLNSKVDKLKSEILNKITPVKIPSECIAFVRCHPEGSCLAVFNLSGKIRKIRINQTSMIRLDNLLFSSLPLSSPSDLDDSNNRPGAPGKNTYSFLRKKELTGNGDSNSPSNREDGTEGLQNKIELAPWEGRVYHLG
jgi:glycosidase